MSFLTAEWRKLAIANYLVEPTVFKDFLPAHTELDLWNGRCYASLVGFMFRNVRLLGLPIPFHTEFEEVNLRFYVRHKSGGEWRRGVVFIKEIVPKIALSIVANTIYKEHYETLPMRHAWKTDDATQTVQYDWKKGDRWNFIRVETGKLSQPIPEGSEAAFITEHYWGYTRIDDSTTFEYEVTHPVWQAYPVKDYSIETDFASVYGEQFGFLTDLEPTSVMLAEGSPITVEKKRSLTGEE